jgi:hypothetical protein
MTTLNAFGFFLFGMVMFFAPAFFPEYFAAKALDGSSTSALWLGVMGLFQGSMGITFLIRNEAVPFAVKLMTLRLPTFNPSERSVPGFVLRPLRDGYLSLESNADSNNDQRVAA